MPVWVAVGGTPQSVARAGTLGLPLAIAIIGGELERFAPLVQLYREAARRASVDPSKLQVGINGHGFIADSASEARDACFPYYSRSMARIGRERGWPPMTRAQFDAGCGLRGALAVGDPDQAIEKILYQHRFFGHQRYLMQMSVGAMPHDSMMRSIELLGTIVAPAVRKALGG